MSDTPFPAGHSDDELQRLIEAFCEGNISLDDQAQLEKLLDTDTVALEQFVVRMDLDARLRRWSLRASQAETLAGNLTEQTPVSAFFVPDTSSLDPLSHGDQGSVPSWASRGLLGFGGLSTLAWLFVSLLLVAVAWFSWHAWFGGQYAKPNRGGLIAGTVDPEKSRTGLSVTSPSPLAIGHVDRLDSQVIIERDGAKQNAVVGMEILPADSLDVLSGGGMELTLADRSQAKLGPRTMLAFTSAREATLREGFMQIDARSRRESTPLAITTPDAQAQIRDAWLSMGADRKRTQIRVAEGMVVASRRTDGMEVEIPEGYCSTIARAVGPGPRRSVNGTALFVVSAKALHAHEDWERFDQILAERIVGDRLWRSAMPVRMRTYDELQAEDLKDCSLIVLSIFPEKAGVEQKLIDLKVPELTIPIVCLEATGFPVLGMTGPTLGKDFGIGRGPLVVDITAENHPLAAGFVGSQLELFAYGRAPYWWGSPNANAQTIVRLHRNPERCLMFAYDRGEVMVGGIAPARRVGLFMIPRGADFDSPGLELVDAAIDWCLDPNANDAVAWSIDESTSDVARAPTQSQVPTTWQAPAGLRVGRCIGEL